MRRACFGVKIDYDNENVVKSKANKIEDIEKLVHKLKLKFK